jgi:GMP synthase (glutamine-hydrolysing)
LKTAIAIRHLAFEDLGCFGPVLERAGYKIHYYDIGLEDLGTLEPLNSELIVVLGGPVGAYEDDRYPFLLEEVRLLKARLSADRPTIGICLGAQLIARALGARVYPGSMKEIGFKPITLSEAGRTSPLASFADVPVLHWHGDTFDLPEGATHLASTDVCRNQAFAYGRKALAVQFHPEAGGVGFEGWLIGHTLELSAAGIDVPTLRAENERLAPALRPRAAASLEAWLNAVG